MFAHDAAWTGRTDAVGPRHPVLKWSFVFPGALISSGPVVGDRGEIYLGTDSSGNIFYSIDSSGAVKWSYVAPSPVMAAAALSTDTVYIGSEEGTVMALTKSGYMKWSFDTGAQLYTETVIGAADTVYVGNENSTFFSIDSSGALLWSYQVASATPLPVTIGTDTVYISGDYNLLNLWQNGSLKWSYALLASQALAPVVLSADGTAYLFDNPGLYSIDSHGALRWSYDSMVWYGGLALSSDAIYLSQTDGVLTKLARDGSLRWSMGLTGGELWSPTLDGTETVYVGSSYSDLYSISPDGSQRWTYHNLAAENVPISTDTLYVPSRRGADGELIVLTEKSTPTPTPTRTPLPTPTPFPQGLHVWLNQSSLRPGDTFTVSVSFTDTILDWDGYVVIVRSDGKVWSIQYGNRLRDGIHPIVYNAMEIHQAWGPVEVFRMQIPYGVAGYYGVYAAILPTGTVPTLLNAKGPFSQLDIKACYVSP